MMKSFLILLVLAGVANHIAAQQTSRIFIANDDHTDYVWTANEKDYDSAFVHMLDYYLDQIDSTAGLPDDFQARFNCDAFYWLEAYEKLRPQKQFDRLIRAIRSGHISVPLNYLVNTYGAQPTEAVIRGMFPAGAAQQRYGLDLRIAVAMENQTLPLGLSSLWAGAGARFSWRGICGCASRLPRNPLSNRQHQLYRYLGQDNQGVVMKWYNHGVNNVIPGGYAETRGVQKPVNVLSEISAVIARLRQLCDSTTSATCSSQKIAGAFGYGWDDLETYVSPAFIAAAKNASNDSVRVRVSNEEDFFAAVDSSCGILPAESVSYGNEWDLYPATMTETTAKMRRALEKLRAAEALSSIVSLRRHNFTTPLLRLRDAAWRSYGAYWEHDWTADGPVTRNDRAAWQERLAKSVAGYSDTLLAASAGELARLISGDPGTDFYIFNPLSWTRNDFADLVYTGPLPVAVFNKESHKQVPSQIVMLGGIQFVRIWADSVPPMGYRLFSVKHTKADPLPDAARLHGDSIENDRYVLRISHSGAIISWKDKLNGKELVKRVNGRFVNDLGAVPDQSVGELHVENSGPVSATIRAVSTDPVAHVARITLFANNQRISIDDSITENFGDVKTWAFSFALDTPATHHEELGAILLVDKKNAGGDYANANCRYDWQTFNHFADMSDRRTGITVSNLDCSFFSLGNSSPDTLKPHAAQLYALAGGQVDRYRGDKDSVVLGMYDQQGEKNFAYHFALTSHNGPFDPLLSMKFALEHQNPLVARTLTERGSAYPAVFSLMKPADPHVLIWSVKPSEQGIANGLIVRSWNLQPQSSSAPLVSAVQLGSVRETSHLEIDRRRVVVKKNRFDMQLSPWQMSTYRLIVREANVCASENF